MPEIDNIINAFGVQLVTDIRKSLIANKVVFGGGGESKLSAKTRFEVKRTLDGYTFNLIMPDYSYWVNVGRKPGNVSKEGQASISEWAKRKGIVGKFQNENLVTRQKLREGSTRKLKPLKKIPFDKAVKQITFLISRKISKKGYEGNHFLDEVLNDGRLEKFRLDLTGSIKQKIIVDIKTA